MTESASEKHQPMDLDEPSVEVAPPVRPTPTTDPLHLDPLQSHLTLTRPNGVVVPEGRRRQDFKATKKKKSTVIGNDASQKTYDALFTGANRAKMGGFEVEATREEIELFHQFPETAFKAAHGRTKGYQEVTPRATPSRATSEKVGKESEDDDSAVDAAPAKRTSSSRKRKAQAADLDRSDDRDDDETANAATTPRLPAVHTGSSTLVAFPGGVIIPEKLTPRRPRSFADMRASQIVRHISEVILSQLGRSEKGAVEVESLYVPSSNTLVIATNNRGAIEKFANDVKKELDDPAFAEANMFLGDLIRAIAVNQEKMSYRDETSLAKLDAAVHGKRTEKFGQGEDGKNARQLCELIKEHVAGPDVLDHTEIADKLDKGTAGIFLMHSSGIHAEQQLLRAFLASGTRTRRAIIRGARNPCFGCYLALKYAREKLGATGLDHGGEPGFTWNGSLASGAAVNAEALVKDCVLDGVKLDEYRSWINAEIDKYVRDGANGSVRVRNRRERINPFPEELTGPYSREGLSAEGYGAASDTDDEDVNAPLLGAMKADIDSIRTKREIAPPPRKRRKVAPRGSTAPDSDAAPATPSKMDITGGSVGGSSAKTKRKTRSKSTRKRSPSGGKPRPTASSKQE